MIEIVNFGGWPNCVRLSNSEAELIITTDVGPRIIRFGMINGPNLLHVSEADLGRTGGQEWHIYGGHRLWHAPEVMPRTYFPDNFPVRHLIEDNVLKLVQCVEATTGIVKEMDIALDQETNYVRITHRLVNTTQWTIETAAWAITAHAAGSLAILPQEPYVDPELDLLPARPIVLWKYTQMTDKRWTWGSEYILLENDPGYTSEQKIGILNKQGWNAVILGSSLMIKKFAFNQDAVYPDFGSNNEAYVNGNLLETESLGPLTGIKPGESVSHSEEWFLLPFDNTQIIDSEESVRKFVRPLIDRVIG
jgi:hypothetical protein